MPNKPTGPDDDFEPFEQLLDRMVEARWIVRYSHSDNAVGAELTPDAALLGDLLARLERDMGGIGPADRLRLWRFLANRR